MHQQEYTITITDFLALANKAKQICVFVDLNATELSDLHIPLSFSFRCRGITAKYSGAAYTVYTFQQVGGHSLDIMEPCKSVLVKPVYKTGEGNTEKYRKTEYRLQFEHYSIVVYFNRGEFE